MKYFLEEWGCWLEGIPGMTDLSDEYSLMTRYEHFLIGSGVGLPPDPFKLLPAIPRDSDLEEVIARRKEYYPPGKEKFNRASNIPNFRDITGLDPRKHSLITPYPEITPDGRIRIPGVVGVVGADRNRTDLSDRIIAQLKFPTEREFKSSNSGAYIREVFDFNNGYRLELVKVV